MSGVGAGAPARVRRGPLGGGARRQGLRLRLGSNRHWSGRGRASRLGRPGQGIGVAAAAPHLSSAGAAAIR